MFLLINIRRNIVSIVGGRLRSKSDKSSLVRVHLYASQGICCCSLVSKYCAVWDAALILTLFRRKIQLVTFRNHFSYANIETKAVIMAFCIVFTSDK